VCLLQVRATPNAGDEAGRVNAARIFTVGDLVKAVRCSGGKLDPAQAAFLLDGPGDFSERGYVARVPDGFVVTEKGAEFSRSVQNMRWAA
jgi:hypothetical protein